MEILFKFCFLSELYRLVPFKNLLLKAFFQILIFRQGKSNFLQILFYKPTQVEKRLTTWPFFTFFTWPWLPGRGPSVDVWVEGCTQTHSAKLGQPSGCQYHAKRPIKG